ncbi:hypothetical protein [Archangium sp.]|uniref:hypothetical protein n=1 Tax=Archangium sp. TaxID=1872627 RepID=UPI00286AB410|nr:hypothetical protein [Archangium sp.]
MAARHRGDRFDADTARLDKAVRLYLGRLATTPASWEDGWYGYRLRVRKGEGAGYYRPFWEMLLGVYDEDISAWVREQLA